MQSGIEDLVKISPSVWPGKELQVQPGDLTLFAPMGCGISGPFPFMPWDNLASAMSRPGYYSYPQRHHEQQRPVEPSCHAVAPQGPADRSTIPFTIKHQTDDASLSDALNRVQFGWQDPGIGKAVFGAVYYFLPYYRK